MGLFNRYGQVKQNQAARLNELDRKYTNAREALIKEQARGYIIAWSNRFKRLIRLCDKESMFEDPQYRAFFLGDAIAECKSFQFDHRKEDEPLSGLLADLGHRLSNRILDLASAYGCAYSDMDSAITYLTQTRHLGDVVDYLEELENLLSLD